MSAGQLVPTAHHHRLRLPTLGVKCSAPVPSYESFAEAPQAAEGSLAVTLAVPHIPVLGPKSSGLLWLTFPPPTLRDPGDADTLCSVRSHPSAGRRHGRPTTRPILGEWVVGHGCGIRWLQVHAVALGFPGPCSWPAMTSLMEKQMEI